MIRKTILTFAAAVAVGMMAAAPVAAETYRFMTGQIGRAHV